MTTNPMHQFNIYRIGPEVNLGGIDISFTNASLFMMLSALDNNEFVLLGDQKKSTGTYKNSIAS